MGKRATLTHAPDRSRMPEGCRPMYRRYWMTASQDRAAGTGKPAAGRCRPRAASLAVLAALALALVSALPGSVPPSPAGAARAGGTTVQLHKRRTGRGH